MPATDTTMEPRMTPGLVAACRASRSVLIVVVALLVLHATLATLTAKYCSITHDEYWHVPVGLLNLSTGQFHYEDLNPPLMRMLCAVPLLPAGADPGPAMASDDLWLYGDQFLDANADRYRSLFFWARLPVVLVSVLTCWITAHWATQLFGVRGGLLALLMISASPAMIANAALATTDLAAAFFFVLTLWRAWSMRRSVTRKNAVLLSCCLGAAQLAKFTCVLLFALAPVVYLLTKPTDESRVPIRTHLKYWIALLCGSVVIINCGYLFQGTGTRLADFQFRSQILGNLQTRMPWTASLSVPLPRDYVLGIDHQRRMMEGDHPVFLDREWRLTGFREYYVMVLLYKLPHAVQLLFLCGLLRAMWQFRVPGELRSNVLLLLPLAVLTVIGSFSKMQLGLRYILPAFPFLYLVAAGSIAGLATTRRFWLASTLIALVCVGVLAPLRFHPHHLGYFNEWIGGTEGGRTKLLDSNIDWGQDLDALADYVAQHPMPHLRLAYFGTVPPSRAGLSYELPPPRMPEPGWYAASVNFVEGRPTPIRHPDGSTTAVDLDAFGYLRFFEPKVRVGSSILVYKLTDYDITNWHYAMREYMRGRQ
ncbi:MAG: glycosyltransferase family 39 protein [Planctomycetota bacterium]|nr:glycosyltransferase family 39 protein [Planctomycetota bacterium]